MSSYNVPSVTGSSVVHSFVIDPHYRVDEGTLEIKAGPVLKYPTTAPEHGSVTDFNRGTEVLDSRQVEGVCRMINSHPDTVRGRQAVDYWRDAMVASHEVYDKHKSEDNYARFQWTSRESREAVQGFLYDVSEHLDAEFGGRVKAVLPDHECQWMPSNLKRHSFGPIAPSTFEPLATQSFSPSQGSQAAANLYIYPYYRLDKTNLQVGFDPRAFRKFNWRTSVAGQSGRIILSEATLGVLRSNVNSNQAVEDAREEFRKTKSNLHEAYSHRHDRGTASARRQAKLIRLDEERNRAFETLIRVCQEQTRAALSEELSRCSRGMSWSFVTDIEDRESQA